MLRQFRFIAAILAFAGLAAPSHGAQRSIVISGDSGGSVVGYSLQAASYRKSRTRLMVTGRCDSACTLYLALPASNICIGEAAYFRFHAPEATSDSRSAKAFMMRQYPGWVRQWIAARGGLTSNLITMRAPYAQRFLPRCPSALAER